MSYFRPIAKDFAVDAAGDELYLNGDLVVEASDQRHIEDIIDSAKGEWREFPALGVEIIRYLNSTGQVANRVGLLRAIRLNLEYDNFDIKKLSVEADGSILVDAKRLR
jgi:hypothetical protein